MAHSSPQDAVATLWCADATSAVCVCVCVYVCVCVCMCVCQKERSTELEQMCVLAGEFRLTESEKANVFAACLVFQWNNCLSWSYDIRELT